MHVQGAAVSCLAPLILVHLGEPTSPPRLLHACGLPLGGDAGCRVRRDRPAGEAGAGLRVRSAHRVVGQDQQDESSLVTGQLVPVVTREANFRRICAPDTHNGQAGAVFEVLWL